MEDFLMRTLSEKSEDYDIKVSRMRTTKGFALISVEYKKQKIDFTNENGNDAYEQEAYELAKLLESITLNQCTLPKTEK